MKTYGKGVEFGDIVLLGEVEKRKNHVYEKNIVPPMWEC